MTNRMGTCFQNARATAANLRTLMGVAALLASCVPDAFPWTDQGSGGAGGQLASGGTNGAGGARWTLGDSEIVLFGFDQERDVDPFSLDTTPSTQPPNVNVGEFASLRWDRGEYGPDGAPGLLSLVASFTDFDQYVTLEALNMDSLRPRDFTATPVLRARVKIVQGFTNNQNAWGGAVLFAKTGSGSVWGQGEWQLLPTTALGTWQELRLDLLAPDVPSGGTFDPTWVRTIGIEFGTGQTVDGGDQPRGMVAYIDLFTAAPQ